MKVTRDRFVLSPAEGKDIKIRSEFDHFKVFYPFDVSFNMSFLKADVIGDIIRCINQDTLWEHEIIILWFNGSLPLGLYPAAHWQILFEH